MLGHNLPRSSIAPAKIMAVAVTKVTPKIASRGCKSQPSMFNYTESCVQLNIHCANTYIGSLGYQRLQSMAEQGRCGIRRATGHPRLGLLFEIDTSCNHKSKIVCLRHRRRKGTAE